MAAPERFPGSDQGSTGALSAGAAVAAITVLAVALTLLLAAGCGASSDESSSSDGGDAAPGEFRQSPATVGDESGGVMPDVRTPPGTMRLIALSMINSANLAAARSATPKPKE